MNQSNSIRHLPGETAPERNIRLTGQHVGALFVARYIAALVGIYIALITPASVTLAIRVGQIDPEGKASSLAFVASIGAAAALFSNPIFGMLSDRSTSRLGQRRPFIFWGFVIGVLAIFAIGVAPSIPLIALGWAIAQIAFNASIAATIAVLPERVPATLRGRVSGFMGMTGQLAVVTGVFLIQLTGTRGAGMFIWPALLGGVLVLPFLLTLREVQRLPGEVPNVTVGSVLGALWINPFQHRDFGLVWAGRFLAWTALYLLTTYKTYFLIDHLGYSTETVAPILTTAMFVLAVAVAVSSIGGGLLSDYFARRKPLVVLASVFFVVAMLVVAFAHNVEIFLIGMAIAGLGNGLYFGVDYALVSEVIPDRENSAGKSMGVFNLSSTIPQTIAPIIAPALLRINAEGSDGNYTSLYLCAAAFALISAVFIQFIKGAK
ncbi:SLC45 family MFS transporter [Agrobacterium rhizogenes]|uniref:Major facilitator superfamily transporter n=1 Tax=Rhizobium rhizogenes NBRC 13257 TaxID=1220581 RepID=A0AA87U7Y0_RHIRH|nr:MFS transporter [Rhizobium rhizogenes]NTF52879.1 SLC45 family MFS transporter [Rhizobium rhizogenes]NTF65881.1 SLC45 family MFS transporter [Rhizobium rhizogenes]NTF98003.1 SLC45 family MFS transporter [Rhizobium rhizogenes]NTG04798.1 SLC45 family MFS transporter [Rhizobium rhizogenes]NTG25211.1 SLC45 family MFS transporter [Rhizobium rhizogenes]